tara:strand:+ start:6893 stop:8212 length:1320 start_codon:yes stop_codon:yes gene_type:complete
MDHSTAILERLTRLHPRLMDLSLGRLEALLEKLGHPEQRLPPTIHIAGTNGKGSTTAYMRSLLEADGKQVHVYTSPHLVRFHERIRLGQPEGGRLVDDATLISTMLEVERINDGAEITQFEITTAIAFKLFAEHKADVLLLEVGLGGRLDATNVVDMPLASVITPISMDHESFLGDSLAKIAYEKAGILKPGVPAIIARQVPEVMSVIAEVAGRIGAPMRLLGQDFEAFAEHGRMIYQTENQVLDLPIPNLVGQHQIGNAAMAIATLETVGLMPAPEARETGLSHAVWPARLQRLQEGALTKFTDPETEIWLDGGHNPDAGAVVASAMAALEERVERPLFLIAGMLNTKDPIGFFEPFESLARHVFTVTIPGADASRDADELAHLAIAAGLSAEPAASVEAALTSLSQNWQYDISPRVLICGSLYLAGEVLKANGTLPE